MRKIIASMFVNYSIIKNHQWVCWEKYYDELSVQHYEKLNSVAKILFRKYINKGSTSRCATIVTTLEHINLRKESFSIEGSKIGEVGVGKLFQK